MLVVFSSIFVVDTKIIFSYNLVAPLKLVCQAYQYIEWVFKKESVSVFLIPKFILG